MLFCSDIPRCLEHQFSKFSGLTLAECQASTKATLSFTFSTGWGRKNITKVHSLRYVKERDHSANIVMDKRDSAWGILLNFTTDKIRAG